jgi:hypothetical protein
MPTGVGLVQVMKRIDDSAGYAVERGGQLGSNDELQVISRRY